MSLDPILTILCKKYLICRECDSAEQVFQDDFVQHHRGHRYNCEGCSVRVIIDLDEKGQLKLWCGDCNEGVARGEDPSEEPQELIFSEGVWSCPDCIGRWELVA